MGTILRREAKQVISDLMDQHRVPRSVWSITPSGELNFLIGARKFTAAVGGGMSYYALRDLSQRVEAAIRDFHARPDRRQVDLEELIEAVN